MRYIKLVLALLVCVAGYSQSKNGSISGCYILKNTESEQYVEIFGNKFLYGVTGDYNRDVLYADATFKWVDDNFIELRSRYRKNHRYDVRQSEDVFESGALHVSLHMPLSWHCGQEVVVWYVSENNDNNGWNEFKLTCSHPNQNILFTLPEGTAKFRLSINPTVLNNVNPANLDCFFDGNRCFILPEVAVDENVNRVDIEIADLGIDYFRMYFVDGEYVKVEEDRITWRGQVFEKSYEKSDLKYIEKMEKNPDVSRRYYVRNSLSQNSRKTRRNN